MGNSMHTCVICGEQVSHRKSAQYMAGRACKSHPEVQNELNKKNIYSDTIGKAVLDFIKHQDGLSYATKKSLSRLKLYEYATKHSLTFGNALDDTFPDMLEKFVKLANTYWKETIDSGEHMFDPDMQLAIEQSDIRKSVDYLNRICYMSSMSAEQIRHYLLHLLESLNEDNRLCDLGWIIKPLNPFITIASSGDVRIKKLDDIQVCDAAAAAIEQAKDYLKDIEQFNNGSTVNNIIINMGEKALRFVTHISEMVNDHTLTAEDHRKGSKESLKLLEDILMIQYLLSDHKDYWNSGKNVIAHVDALYNIINTCLTKRLDSGDEVINEMNSFINWVIDEYSEAEEDK